MNKWEDIFQLEKSQGILLRLGKSGILPKILENSEKIDWYIEKKNTGKVREICQSVIVQTLQIWYHILNKFKEET